MSLLFDVLPVVQKVGSAKEGAWASYLLHGWLRFRLGLLLLRCYVGQGYYGYLLLSRLKGAQTSRRLDPVWCGLFAVMQIGLSLFGEMGADGWAGCWGTWLACGDVLCSRQLGWVWNDGVWAFK
ncbi:hypothetical protein E3N88_15696 [Mikania micrantha]|uniref:Uncharacterized protein n=1 Tax=Mikania micrantha TaxID=192012 RepID=A0A5N6NYW7_9ASTR|nr:hypothetical protein E3N88_15696 [Mikania micrantha]